MTEILLGSLVIMGLVVGLAMGLLAFRSRLLPSGDIGLDVNDRMHLRAKRGVRLLDVLHGFDIPIPAACGGKGTCGLCRVTVLGDGAGTPQATERGVLSPRERRAHVRLACQTTLSGDCAVWVPDGILSAGSGFACTVASARMLAPLIREIVLNMPDDRLSTFRAGDFMQITAPAYRLDFATLELPEPFREPWEIAGWSEMRVSSEAAVTRAYSLANRPEDAGTAVFNIRLAVPPPGRETEIPPGLVSSWLFTVNPGDSVTASGPFGDFHVRPGTREMIFVGGGVGMAPLRAMIHQELAGGTDRRIRYFYGARAAADLFYSEEFEALARQHKHFSWRPALSDPAPGDRWTGASGFIHEILQAEMTRHASPEECEYYLCGPPVMISAVLATLQRLGVEPDAIFYDDFGA
ncbi:NADH:ubiquinone reductase (Na(+)-transporting) subunit F [Silicimonas algicola]|uniref:Na(+)-translocating NADH-quinone reductase subunit F n=1 Tax=Silicimonas algicola TaxID=1826607 RepID=A0A316GFG9_9RHOB|nr:NADH:ubiquinone reductase (Na(+)-transporting) subunit F [Silicimonas algicola]AZQ66619.1 NADH:ubiquinone reductase (Na(+)-transporting) subunit F [Silicimonas algicola]PWK58965.1 Na+-transporting NADH:ubiquinone oxidoreductase subunit F [Silicimonas algicola]